MEKPPPKSTLSETLLAETEQLQAAWQRHDAAFLDTYLIRDVEDPRINIQSILTRHFLIGELFGDRYAAISEHELYFAILVNWLIKQHKSKRSRHEIAWLMKDVLDRLLEDTRESTAEAVPSFIADAFKKLSFPNYISALLMWTPNEYDEDFIPDYLLSTFEHIWAEILAEEHAEPLSVIEAACGSANDYRFLDRYGLGRFLHYTGFDLSVKNISNAKKHFPGTDFRIGSVFEIPTGDNTYDYCFMHDLFEHLSPEGINRAVTEIHRVTSRKTCLHFFNMADIEEDIIQKKEDYHWNRLSLSCLQKRFKLSADCFERRHIDSWLTDCFAYPDHYNKNAYSWYVCLEDLPV